MAACVADYNQACLNGAAAAHSGFTPDAIQSCGAAVAGQNCTDYFTLTALPACSPRGGTVADGGPCSSGWQCASGRCSFAVPACGTCLPRVAAGQVCQGGDCDDNFACSATAPGATSMVCTPVVNVGGACNDGNVCPINTFCDPTTHVCKTVPKLGQACDPQTTYFCDLTGPPSLCDSNTNTCAAGVTTVGVGSSCGSDAGTNVTCPGNCISQTDGGVPICQAYQGVGQACDSTSLYCAGGLACDSGTCGTCDGRSATSTARTGSRLVRTPGPLERLRPATAFLRP
jgi:hypothetical protein